MKSPLMTAERKQKIPRNPYHGWLNLDKPYGLSSNDALMRAKRMLRPEKIGHAGTLDPLASGVLPVALGAATKCISLMMDATKTYRFTVQFGERRSTDDLEGEVIATSVIRPTREAVLAVLPQFLGTQLQMPPVYSAIKIAGRRACDLAREGNPPELAPRSITIDSLKFLESMDGNHGIEKATFTALVHKGTYIRALARDIAQKLGTEGYVTELIRESVGNFTLAHAISLDLLEETVHKAAPSQQWLQPLSAVLDGIPAHSITVEHWRALRHGQAILAPLKMPPCEPLALMLGPELVALARFDGRMIFPVRLLRTISN
jgi:tRNA pseudouridine55 synthase